MLPRDVPWEAMPDFAFFTVPTPSKLPGSVLELQPPPASPGEEFQEFEGGVVLLLLV